MNGKKRRAICGFREPSESGQYFHARCPPLRGKRNFPAFTFLFTFTSFIPTTTVFCFSSVLFFRLLNIQPPHRKPSLAFPRLISFHLSLFTFSTFGPSIFKPIIFTSCTLYRERCRPFFIPGIPVGSKIDLKKQFSRSDDIFLLFLLTLPLSEEEALHSCNHRRYPF